MGDAPSNLTNQCPKQDPQLRTYRRTNLDFVVKALQPTTPRFRQNPWSGSLPIQELLTNPVSYCLLWRLVVGVSFLATRVVSITELYVLTA